MKFLVSFLFVFKYCKLTSNLLNSFWISWINSQHCCGAKQHFKDISSNNKKEIIMTVGFKKCIFRICTVQALTSRSEPASTGRESQVHSRPIWRNITRVKLDSALVRRDQRILWTFVIKKFIFTAVQQPEFSSSPGRWPLLSVNCNVGCYLLERKEKCTLLHERNLQRGEGKRTRVYGECWVHWEDHLD